MFIPALVHASPKMTLIEPMPSICHYYSKIKSETNKNLLSISSQRMYTLFWDSLYVRLVEPRNQYVSY